MGTIPNGMDVEKSLKGMEIKSPQLRTCSRGHQYYKSSDCPVCPVCESTNKTGVGFLALFSAPARRALEREGISSPLRLSEYTEKDVLKLHGIGKTSIPIMNRELQKAGLQFKSIK